MRPRRIEHPDKRSTRLTLWLGLLGVLVVLGIVFLLFTHAQSKKQEPGQTNYLKPVPSDSKLRSELTDVQYHVTRENGTETAFQNLYWDNYRPGIYVDVITGEPLFSSRDKFEGNTGRPCFTKPISPERIVQRRDTSHNMDRTEVRAARSDSHLGHVFNDGPLPTGLRYAINSAALKFVPLETMQAQGYGEFIPYVTPEAGQPSASPATPGSK
jgi:peptide methionine sulfoxide reductase msrA/msrB